MIFGELTCRVYDKVKTTLMLDMSLQKESNGRPRWYDYGQQYDNLTIQCKITAENGAVLEAFFREQDAVNSNIDITFENDEWLYDYTGGFTIQSYKLMDKINAANSEWGYEVTLSPVDSIDLTALTGSRVECTGSGYISYSNSTIPQPKKFEPMYNTKKYAGLTHGSSYSDELPTNEYDSTSFKCVMTSGNMRQLVDDIVTDRGAEFYVNFPANTDPFGLAHGTGNKICIVSGEEFTFTRENGDWWSIGLGLYYIAEGQVAPVFAVQPTSQTTASGGSVTFGPVSVTGTPTPTLQWWRAIGYTYWEAPTFTESEWLALASSGTDTWSGATVRFNCAAGQAEIWDKDDETGAVSFAEGAIIWSSESQGGAYCMPCEISNSAVTYYVMSQAFRTKLDHRWAAGGADTTVSHTPSSPLASGDTVKTTITVTGSSVLVRSLVNDGAKGDFSDTFSSGYDTNTDYYLRMRSVWADVTYTKQYIQGVGFSVQGNKAYEALVGETGASLTRNNIGTTGDTFGTKYKCVATNTAGSTDSNEVTATETP